MARDYKVTIRYGGQELVLELPRTPENDRYADFLEINGVLYHVEAHEQEQYMERYTVDDYPDYVPTADENGKCILFVPFEE